MSPGNGKLRSRIEEIDNREFLRSIDSRSIISKKIHNSAALRVRSAAHENITKIIENCGFVKAPRAENTYYGRDGTKKEFTKLVVKPKTLQIMPRNVDYIPYYDISLNSNYYHTYDLEPLYADYIINGKSSIIYKILSNIDLAKEVRELLQLIRNDYKEYLKQKPSNTFVIPSNILAKGNRQKYTIDLLELEGKGKSGVSKFEFDKWMHMGGKLP